MIGHLAVRTAGIYTIMITLAIGVRLLLFTQQNYDDLQRLQRLRQRARRPSLFGVDWRAARCRSTISALGVAAVCYLSPWSTSRASTFGLSLQAIRDNPRRMRALGFQRHLHRVLAYALAGFIAALGGVLWSGTTGASRRARSASIR